MSSWDYRLVDFSNEDGKCIKVMEVWYGENELPWGYGPITIMGDTADEAREEFELVKRAFAKPILKASDLDTMGERE